VFLALKSGEMAADAIIEGFAKNDFSPAQLGKWGQTLCDGMHAIRKLVYAFYTKGFSFGKFMRMHPEFKKNLVDLLIGDVFRPEVNQIFDTMEKMVPLPEAIPLENNFSSPTRSGVLTL
jgi:flavin-dependent dehydrogenase